MFSACAGERSSPPSLLLITIDTLRPDALGWVAGANETPAIDALARAGFRCRAAVSPTPLTLPAHTSIMTARVPRRHGVRDNGQVLGDDLPTLAATLRGRGFATGAFVSGYPLRALFGLDRGFDTYDDTLPVGREGWLERPADDTTTAALAWLRTTRPPWLLWVHYYDPHDPYELHADVPRSGPRAAYDSEVAYTDRAVGTLLRGVAAGGGPVVTVLTGDHGEAFGEHGEWTHGFFLYDTTVLVPLVVHAPGLIRPGECPTPVRLVDLAPTLLDLTGTPLWSDIDGTSLTPMLRGEPQVMPAADLETLQPWLTYGWAPLRALRQADRKLIVAPRPELYDLQADPEETHNLIAARPDDAQALRAKLTQLDTAAPRTARRTDDPEAAERLRALGYVGGGTPDDLSPDDLPDPKDRLAERATLVRAEQMLRDGDLRGALAAFDAVLATDPHNPFATLRSGIALLKLGDLGTAVSRLTASVARDPDQPEARFALADALTRSGAYERAIAEWRATVRLQPRRSAAWGNLGTVLSLVGQRDEARQTFTRALELEPTNDRFRANVAALARAAGTPE